MSVKSNPKIVSISLFSGCGGLDIGSEEAGVSVIAAIDNDHDSIETLKLNSVFKQTEIFEEDIRKFDLNKFKIILNNNKIDKFIIIGGPPCQPFSKAGYWVGNKQRKGILDSRNLVDEFLVSIKELKPDGFVFENVESLFHPTNKNIIETIKITLDKLKYNYKIIKANALDYGVPQKRKRIFILGSKKKIVGEPKKTHFPIEFAEKNNLLKYESVGKFIDKFNDDKYAEPSEKTSKGTYGVELKKVPPGKNYIALTERRGYKNPKFVAGKRFWSFLLKLDPNLPSWTIAAQPGPWTGPFHWTSRRLRVPEIAALQTFPENYKFYGSRRSIQKQIGNAVPPKMAKAMIEFLKDNI